MERGVSVRRGGGWGGERRWGWREGVECRGGDGEKGFGEERGWGDGERGWGWREGVRWGEGVVMERGVWVGRGCEVGRGCVDGEMGVVGRGGGDGERVWWGEWVGMERVGVVGRGVWWGETIPYATPSHQYNQTYLCRTETVPKPTYVGQRLCPNLLMSVRDWAQTYSCRTENPAQTY